MFSKTEKHQTRRTDQDRRNAREEIFRRRFQEALHSPRIWL